MVRRREIVCHSQEQENVLVDLSRRTEARYLRGPPSGTILKDPMKGERLSYFTTCGALQQENMCELGKTVGDDAQEAVAIFRMWKWSEVIDGHGFHGVGCGEESHLLLLPDHPEAVIGAMWTRCEG